MMILLALTIATTTTTHHVEAMSYDWTTQPPYMSYTESGQLYVCTGQFVFGYDGGAGRMGADRCNLDSIKRNGFE